MFEKGLQSRTLKPMSPLAECRGEGTAHPALRHVNDDGLSLLLEHVRRDHGVDFASYDAGVVVQRVARRMHARGLEDIRDYVRVVEASAAERRALYRDLLIGKTAFFRDPECFDAL